MEIRKGNMNANGLALFCSGFCFASFAWGMVKHFRRFGKPSPTMIVTGLLGVFFAILQFVGIVRRPVRFPLLAGFMYVASAALFWWAVGVTRGKLAACGQGAVSEQVVVCGPYRYIRHPFYTSYNLAWVAGFAVTAWWATGIAAVTMAALYERAAREEERGLLTSALSEKYQEYKRRTGKYLPWRRLVAD
jgi:protein-S-isoprenylcysteine O-methyltransferase Ste14